MTQPELLGLVLVVVELAVLAIIIVRSLKSKPKEPKL